MFIILIETLHDIFNCCPIYSAFFCLPLDPLSRCNVNRTNSYIIVNENSGFNMQIFGSRPEKLSDVFFVKWLNEM